MSDQSMCCTCGAELEFPLDPRELYEHRDHLIDGGAKQLRIDLTRKAQPDGAKTVGFDF